MKVTVMRLDGTSFHIEVKPDATVADLKKKIEEDQDSDVYPACCQILNYDGKCLKNETTLVENNVIEGSCVTMVLEGIPMQAEPTVSQPSAAGLHADISTPVTQPEVRTNGPNSNHLDLLSQGLPSTSSNAEGGSSKVLQENPVVEDLKKKIQEDQGSEVYPECHQILTYDGKFLKNETTLVDNNVTEGSSIVIMGKGIPKKAESTVSQPSAAGLHANISTPVTLPEVDEDRISDLPKEMLEIILSRLSTKEAICTSSLSKAWRFCWMLTSKVKICDDSVQDQHKKVFLNSLQKALTIQNLFEVELELPRTSWGGFEDPALPDHYVDFLLCIRGINIQSWRKFKGILLSCQVPSYTEFSNLVSLKLINVLIFREAGNRTLSFSVPCAKEILFCDCYWNFMELSIFAPALKHFSSSTTRFNSHLLYSIRMSCTNLQTLNSYHILERILLTGSRVECATLKNCKDERDFHASLSYSGDRVADLLGELSPSLLVLTLSVFLVEALMQRKRPSMPSCIKLQKLTIFADPKNYVCGSTSRLLKLLHATPYLKVLVIKMVEWEIFDYDSMEIMPSCLTYLEEVQIHSESSEIHVPQLALAKFMLKNCTRLKKFQYVGGQAQSDGILETLLSCFRASPDVVTSVQINDV